MIYPNSFLKKNEFPLFIKEGVREDVENL